MLWPIAIPMCATGLKANDCKCFNFGLHLIYILISQVCPSMSHHFTQLVTLLLLFEVVTVTARVRETLIFLPRAVVMPGVFPGNSCLVFACCLSADSRWVGHTLSSVTYLPGMFNSWSFPHFWHTASFLEKELCNICFTVRESSHDDSWFVVNGANFSHVTAAVFCCATRHFCSFN